MEQQREAVLDDELSLWSLRNTETGQVAHTCLLLTGIAETTNARANKSLPYWPWRWFRADEPVQELTRKDDADGTTH